MKEIVQLVFFLELVAEKLVWMQNAEVGRGDCIICVDELQKVTDHCRECFMKVLDYYGITKEVLEVSDDLANAQVG